MNECWAEIPIVSAISLLSILIWSGTISGATTVNVRFFQLLHGSCSVAWMVLARLIMLRCIKCVGIILLRCVDSVGINLLRHIDDVRKMWLRFVDDVEMILLRCIEVLG